MRHFMMVLLLITLVACGSSSGTTTLTSGSGTGGQLVRADVAREALSPNDPRLRDVASANNAFGAELYRTAGAAEQGNLIFSPYSIGMAFSMVYAGAQGETERQLADTLHLLPQDEQHAGLNALDQYLMALGQQPQSDDTQGSLFQLNIANAVWGQHDLSFKQPYLDVLARSYGAGLQVVDFQGDPEGNREAINAWIEEQTNGKIKDMLAPNTINTATRLVLANAIYFKASWRDEFSPEQTKEGPFTKLDGTTVSVPMMQHGSTRYRYVDGEGYQAVSLPYLGDNVSMLVILPDDGRFAEIEGRLSAELLAEARTPVDYGIVNLTLPRFDIGTSLDLRQLLEAMGMDVPFRDSADFSGMTDAERLFISSAIHRATITVDEEGTEAAAATVISMEATGMPTELATVVVDRPFIFAIIDDQSGAALFLGRILDPSA